MEQIAETKTLLSKPSRISENIAYTDLNKALELLNSIQQYKGKEQYQPLNSSMVKVCKELADLAIRDITDGRV